jgi:hypothetical protein
MLRKLPGLIWTVALLAFVVKRFVPPETRASLIGKARGAMATSAPTPSTPAPDSAPPAASNGADLHTPLPVA